MTVLLTLTGRPGAGKTTLARELIQETGARLIASNTTRARRESDMPGEYHYRCDPERMRQEYLEGGYLWVAQHGSHSYGTQKEDLEIAIRGGGIRIMIVVPSVMPRLRGFLRERQVIASHVPVFVSVPEEAELERRLRARGASARESEMRLKESRGWRQEAVRSREVTYYFVDNGGASPARAYAHLKKILAPYR